MKLYENGAVKDASAIFEEPTKKLTCDNKGFCSTPKVGKGKLKQILLILFKTFMNNVNQNVSVVDKKSLTIGGTIPADSESIKYVYDQKEAWTLISDDAICSFQSSIPQLLKRPLACISFLIFSGMPRG